MPGHTLGLSASNKSTCTVEGRVKATFNDMSAESGDLVYSLWSGEGQFQLDSVSGVLRTVRRPLDHEAAESSSPTFRLVVCARVRLSPRLSDCINVTVNVLDVNDNKPLVRQVRDELRPQSSTSWQGYFYIA